LIDAEFAGAGLIYIQRYMVDPELDGGTHETVERDADVVSTMYP
jgi:hypothetical protein